MDQNNIPVCCCNNCKFTSYKGCELKEPFKSKCLPNGFMGFADDLIYKNGITFKRKYRYEYNYFEPKEEIINQFYFIKKEEMEL